MNRKILKFVVIGLGTLLILIGIARASYVIVPAGNVGVYELFGKVKDTELQPGFHLKNPFAKITLMSVRTQQYTMNIVTKEGNVDSDDSIRALTKEGLSIDLDITVLYHLIPDKASDVYKNIGINYDDTIIRPEVRSTIREVVASYEAKDIYSEKRAEVRDKIFGLISWKIDSRGIKVEDVLLRNVNLPKNLADAIEAKLQAEQEAQRYEFVLQTERKEAERKRIEAEGQRNAQQLINQSLTDKYLYYLYVQNIGKCEGTYYVPINPQTGLPIFKTVE